MPQTAPDSADAPSAEEAGERAALRQALTELQVEFEHRALTALTEPLFATPLTMQQLKVLAVIALAPDRATAGELADVLGVSVASMSGIVDRLVEHGMVERVEDRSDRRVRRLIVTAAGNAALRGLLSSSGSIPEPVLERISLVDLRALVRGISAVNRVSAELEEAAGG